MPSKIPDSKVIEMYNLFSFGESIKCISEKFDVSERFVSNVVHGRIKQHLNLSPYPTKGNSYSSRTKSIRQKILDGTDMDMVSGCWEWNKHVLLSGYGQIRIGKKLSVAHRASYEAFIGPIQDGMLACHKCDNRRCCNPDHLFLGTQADNMNDMKLKGRSHFGCRSKNAKINNSIAISIAEMLIAGGRNCDVARKFNVNPQTVLGIKTGRIWSKITGIDGGTIPRIAQSNIGEQMAIDIAGKLKEGHCDKDLALLFNAPIHIIRKIKYGKTWAKVTGIQGVKQNGSTIKNK